MKVNVQSPNTCEELITLENDKVYLAKLQDGDEEFGILFVTSEGVFVFDKYTKNGLSKSVYTKEDIYKEWDIIKEITNTVEIRITY